jgi:small subunit ribosomal protein S4
MARYTGPTWKKSRRFGFSILENGKELSNRPYAPGQHGQRRRKLSEYGTQLNEKQKVRFMYGMNEKQFRKLFDQAGKKQGVHGNNFMIALESRLDNIVYRAGFAETRAQARQLVNHGHILLNGKKATVPSMVVKPGDTVEVREKSLKLAIINNALENRMSTVDFVSVDKTKKIATYERYPEMSELNRDVNQQLIVEFYNR